MRLLLRRINRIFQIVSYSFSTSNIHPSITKTEQSRISIIINQDMESGLSKFCTVVDRTCTMFVDVLLNFRLFLYDFLYDSFHGVEQLFLFGGDLPWWKNHGHLSSIKCSPIGQGNFTNFHELGKPVLPLFPTRATVPPFCSPQGCTSVSHQYVTVQTSAPAQ